MVTDPTDDDAANPKPGTLRAGVVQNKPLWITFEKDMVITLTQELVINSDKTIDGRGAKVEITGTGLTLYNVKNVIIHGIHIHDVKEAPGGMIKNSDGPPGMRQKTDGDGICVTGSTQIWIDHCSFSKGVDGLIDVTLRSTGVTISNSKFTQHHKVINKHISKLLLYIFFNITSKLNFISHLLLVASNFIHIQLGKFPK